jgi:hypothetical protein
MMETAELIFVTGAEKHYSESAHATATRLVLLDQAELWPTVMAHLMHGPPVMAGFTARSYDKAA